VMVIKSLRKVKSFHIINEDNLRDEKLFQTYLAF
jgi:hypothetical protein